MSKSNALLATLLGTGLLVGQSARATDFIKADNATNLNLDASYTAGSGIPGTGDRIVIDSTLTTNRSAALGANLSIDGIHFATTATRVFTITGSETLTLGSSGILIEATTGAGLVFSGSAISLGADQTWNFGTRGATFNGNTTIDENGHTLIINATGTQIFFHNGTQTLNAQITGTGAALTLDSAPSAATLTLTNSSSTFTGGAAISSGSTLIASSMRVGAETSSAVGTGQIQLKGGTFKYAGSTATTSQNVVHDSRYVSTFEVTTAGQTLTLGTFNNTNAANTGLTANGVNLGGAGNLILTAVKDSTNATRTATTLTKFGGGTVTLTGASTYTGATTVNEGTLALGASGSINTSSAITVAAGATFDTSAKSSYAFNTANATTFGVSSTTAGHVNAAALTFTGASLVFDFGSTDSLQSSYNILSMTGFSGSFAGVTATGTSISGTFINDGSGNWTLNGVGGYNLTFSQSLGTLTAVFTAVPEPSTYAVVFGAVALAGATLRRRRASQHA